MIPSIISNMPENNGAYLLRNLPNKQLPMASPNVIVTILNINVDMIVNRILTPVILAATPVPKLLNVNPNAISKASFMFISLELSKSDFLAYSIISSMSFKASSFDLVLLISFIMLWTTKYIPKIMTTPAPKILATDLGKNVDIYAPTDIDKNVPVDVTNAIIRFASIPSFIFFIP